MPEEKQDLAWDDLGDKQGLKTKKAYKFKLPDVTRQFVVEIVPDGGDPKAGDDKVQLKSQDGSYDQTLTVSSDGKSEGGKTKLVFDKLPVGKKYDCTVDRGADGKYLLFKGLEIFKKKAKKEEKPPPPRPRSNTTP